MSMLPMMGGCIARASSNGEISYNLGNSTYYSCDFWLFDFTFDTAPFKTLHVTGTTSTYFYWDIYGDNGIITSIRGSSTSSTRFDNTIDVSGNKRIGIYMRNNGLSKSTYLIGYTLE